MSRKGLLVMMVGGCIFSCVTYAKEAHVKHGISIPAAQVKSFDINLATLKDWEDIKGIGKKKAATIMSYKSQHGDFTNVSQLAGVKGISQSTMNKLEKKNHIKFAVHAAH